jgi:LemA protein
VAIAIIVIVVVIVLLIIFAVAVYNGLIRLKNRVDNAWAQIDVQLTRRHDLIPNLVETVKGYAAHESQTLEAANAAREAGAEVVAVATIADRATGAAEKFAEAGFEYRFVYGLEELGLA